MAAFTPNRSNGNVTLAQQKEPIMATNVEIRQSAREVIDRLGAAAVDYMHNRLATLEKDGTPQERDQAYRLLSVVEQMLEEES